MKKKDRETLLVVGVGGLILALYLYLTQLNAGGTVHSGCSSCVDTDNGNPFIKGTTTCIRGSSVFVNTDYCDASNYLWEYECRDEAGLDTQEMYLKEYPSSQRTCVDGAFLPPTTLTSSTTTPSTTLHPTTTTTLCTSCEGNGGINPKILLGAVFSIIVGGLLWVGKRK